MVGRKEHSQYKPLGFVKKRNDKGENVAFCIICHHHIRNTAVKRLEAHRRVCKKNCEYVLISQANKNLHNKINNNIYDLNMVSCSTDDIENVHEKDIDSNKYKASKSVDIDSTYNASIGMLVNNEELNSNNTNQLTINNIIPNFHVKHHHEKNKVYDIPKCSRKKQNIKIKAFMDDIDEKEKLKIDKALIELLIACRIDFNCLESKYLKNLFYLLRPTYCLPTMQELNQLFDQVYDKHIDKTGVSDSSGILLINIQKNNQVTSMSFNSERNFLFIKTENLADMQTFLNASVLETKRKYNKEIYAVVSNYEQHMPFKDTNLNFWYFKCMSQRLRSFQEAVDYNFVQEVKNLILAFQHSELQEDIIKYNGESFSAIEKEDCCNYLKSLKSCLKNFKPMRQVVCTSKVEFSQNIISLLFDNQFELKLKENIIILEYIQEKLNNKHNLNYTRATELEDWIILLNKTESENVKKSIEQQIQCLSDAVTLMANILHPCYQGRNLTYNKEENMKKVVEFLIAELNEKGVQSYFQYRDNIEIFGKLSAKNIQSPTTYWRLCQKQHADLANFALKILQIPAFTNEIRTDASESFLNDFKQEKISELYYSLKINE